MTVTEFIVIIPARYGSTRLPGKPLRSLAGRPMIEHVYRRAVASGAVRVLVATDDRRIVAACQAFGAEALMTDPAHATGTDRLAEVVRRERFPDEAIVVNLQGDEPLMPPRLLHQVAEVLDRCPGVAIATLATPLHDPAELASPHVVKVVVAADRRALYFSRAPIPWDREAGSHTPAVLTKAGMYRRHLGIYAYRAAFLRRYQMLSPCELAQHEQLEQLKMLWHGESIQVEDAQEPSGPGVDTEADLLLVERRLSRLSH
ncbi:3-deoxy-manno-octulosonate cytidylyltransferase [Nitrococcus mobilis]|uniref:3-deoxy-manno-octulosonate cytidylyltransferase n=1 Tax=Nitrococcus mobilis Nb-231 TaxID=314278 RepID=A4BML0_9GAMM|nr:3-deoxy-manno-octulosonate cytidylyltransferase [Nitrococcus mobilis Nb-231]